MRAPYLFIGTIGLATSVGACSAIVSPDPSRLYGDDSGGIDGGGIDAGGLDGGNRDGGGVCPASCDDSFPCTTDSCEGGSCVHLPEDLRCADDERCSVTLGCVPERCTTDAECDDGDFCNGVERCGDGGGCSAGPAPSCADDTPCTLDSCADGACVHLLRDDDGDGFGASSATTSPSGPEIACAGTDCDDSLASVNPDATEMCNGRDDDCNGTSDEGCMVLPDRCASAQVIPLVGGMATVRGSQAALADDYRVGPGCMVGTGGRDAVYAIDIEGLVDVRVDTFGSAADTVLAISTTCDSAGFQVVCNDDADTPAGTGSRIWGHRLGSAFGSARIYILVDAYDAASSGDYVLNVRVTSAAADACPSASSLALDISGGGTVAAFSTDVTGSQRGSCQTAGEIVAPEAVYFFRSPDAANVEFRAYSTDFAPDLYLRDGACASGSEIDCVAGSALGGGLNGAELDHSVRPRQNHFLFVDGGRGAYVLYYIPR
jgi:hypothetical protein